MCPEIKVFTKVSTKSVQKHNHKRHEQKMSKKVPQPLFMKSVNGRSGVEWSVFQGKLQS